MRPERMLVSEPLLVRGRVDACGDLPRHQHGPRVLRVERPGGTASGKRAPDRGIAQSGWTTVRDAYAGEALRAGSCGRRWRRVSRTFKGPFASDQGQLAPSAVIRAHSKASGVYGPRRGEMVEPAVTRAAPARLFNRAGWPRVASPVAQRAGRSG